MSFKNITFGEKIFLEGILVIYGTEHQLAFLLEWKDKAIEMLLATTDADFNAHFRKIGGITIKINDMKFIETVAGNLFPLCGNYYTYVNKISLTGVVRKECKTKQELTLFEISEAYIWDYEGHLFDLPLSS